MTVFANLIFRLLTDSIVQQIIVLGLTEAAKRSDNTVDDRIVEIVKAGFDNRVNPINRVVGQ